MLAVREARVAVSPTVRTTTTASRRSNKENTFFTIQAAGDAMRTRGRLFDILSHVRQTVCDHPFSDASSCHGCCATAVGSSPPPPLRQPAWVRGKEWAKNWNRHPDFGPTVGCSPEHPCSQPRFSRSRFRSLLNLTAAFPHNARFAARLWTMYHSARGWHKKKKDGLDPGSDCSRGHSDGVLPRQDLRVWHGPSGRVSVPDLPISARWRQLTVGFPLCPCGNPMRQPLASGAGPW